MRRRGSCWAARSPRAPAPAARYRPAGTRPRGRTGGGGRGSSPARNSSLEHRDDVVHVDVADLLAGDADLGDRGERDLVAVEHRLEVQHGVAPVRALGLDVGDVEAGVARYRLA